MRHCLSLEEFTAEEILEIISLGLKIKSDLAQGAMSQYMKSKTLGMIFEKSSTRTRVSFEAGIYQLGGMGLFLSSSDIQLGRGEPMKDTARVISRMVDMVMIRTYEQKNLEEFAKYSNVPVINGLSDSCHPVQLLADYMTMIEYGKDRDPVIAYIGDGNNMANSWLMLATKLGFELRIATPKGYELEQSTVEKALNVSMGSGAKLTFTNEPNEAVRGADVVVTDTWASMGQESQKSERMSAFEGYKVDDTMMSRANENAIFMHCLPAYREQEVSESVLEGEQSVVFDEAENRLHAQKGLMVWLDRHRD